MMTARDGAGNASIAPPPCDDRAHSGCHARAPRPSMLVIEPQGSLSPDYRVRRDRVEIARIGDTEGPLHGRFAIAGIDYRVGGSLRTLPGLAVIAAVWRAVTGRTVHALTTADGRVLAKARARGWGRDGYDLVIDGMPSALAWDRAAGVYRWRFIGGGDGVVARLDGRGRGVQVTMPDTMADAVQVFLGLVALQRWEFLTRGGG